jgi:hypothetical protein
MHKFTFLLFLSSTVLISLSQQSDSSVINSYLRGQMEVLNIEKQLPVQQFDKSVFDNSLFLFGENHGAANPQAVDMLLFKQFYKQAGVRYYIAEIDMVKAWMLNNYLKDGNEQWLQKIFKSWVADTLQWANRSNYLKFQQLRQFYKSLPPKDKFIVLGVDVVQDYSLLREYGSHLLKNKTYKKLQYALDSLLTLTDTIQYSNRKVLGEFARRLLPKLLAEKEGLQKAFATSTPAMLHYVTGLSFISAGMYRDSIMYRNFESIVEKYKLQKSKLYGFLGFYHCLQTGYDKSMPFAALLQHNGSVFAGKTISIQMFALQSKTLLPYVGQLKQMMPEAYVSKLRSENADFINSKKYVPYDLSNDAQMMYVNGIANLKQVTASNTTTLFRLTAPGSPFLTNKLLGEVSGFQSIKFTKSESKTTDAFQYVILFRDSKAGVPIE